MYQQQLHYKMQDMVSQQSPTIYDDILKRLHEMEQRIVNQTSSKISYNNIINEPINPSVLIKQFPFRFEIPCIGKFKGKEDPR